MILNAQGRLTGELKPKHKWDKADNEGSEANAKALFSIFNGVCLNEFCRIVNCKCVKETWDILQVTHEGMSFVMISKLKMLATKFEDIKMYENQNFSSFYYELSDIINFLFNAGEPIPNSKVVRKILRSLLEKFRPKVTVIEESKDINSMRVDELIGSIQTYEMTPPSFQKPKDFIFKALENEDKDIEMQYDITNDKLTHMAKRIKRVMKFNKRFYKN